MKKTPKRAVLGRLAGIGFAPFKDMKIPVMTAWRRPLMRFLSAFVGGGVMALTIVDVGWSAPRPGAYLGSKDEVFLVPSQRSLKIHIRLRHADDVYSSSVHSGLDTCEARLAQELNSLPADQFKIRQACHPAGRVSFYSNEGDRRAIYKYVDAEVQINNISLSNHLKDKYMDSCRLHFASPSSRMAQEMDEDSLLLAVEQICSGERDPGGQSI